MAQMDRGHAWSDYTLLNSTWSRAVGSATWTDSTLVRFRVSSSRTSRSVARSVKVFSNLHVEYSVPWPLVYIFRSVSSPPHFVAFLAKPLCNTTRPDTMDIYSQIFTFLLQMRRAKHLVDRLSLVKPSDNVIPALQRPERELRLYYALRRKLAWIVSIAYEFFMSVVIQEEVDSFARKSEGTTSVQDFVDAHEAHVGKLRDRLLLNEKVGLTHLKIVTRLADASSPCCRPLPSTARSSPSWTSAFPSQTPGQLLTATQPLTARVDLPTPLIVVGTLNDRSPVVGSKRWDSPPRATDPTNRSRRMRTTRKMETRRRT